jgi:hypothetical protein
MPDLRDARRRKGSLPPSIPPGGEEQVPDYIDQSTLASSTPVPVMDTEHVVIDVTGATPAPAKHAEAPSEAKKKKERRAKRAKATSHPPAEVPWQIPWIRIGIVGAGFLFVIVLGTAMATSYSMKASASATRRDAGVAVVNQVHQLRGLVDGLATAGADRETLEEAWFRFQDAKPDDRAETAVAFARVSVSEADRVGAHGAVGNDIHVLEEKLDTYEVADAAWTETKSSGLGRLTGALGLF